MEKFRILGTLLLLWIALFQVDKIDATALSNFNLPCVALRKNLKISGEYQLSSQLINVGPPTGERNFGVVFNAEDEKNYDFAYLSYDVHDKCIKVQPGYVEKGVITKLKKKLGCIDRQPKKWNALKLIVKEECNHCNNVEAFVDGRSVGSFEAHFATRGFGGVLAENGFNNIAEFRKFDIAPIIPDLSDKSITATATSGRAMETVPYADLNIGSKIWFDRRYTFTNLGNYTNDCTFIRGSNDDKNTDKSVIQTILQVPFASTVYLDFWGGSVHLQKVSSWIGDWTETTKQRGTQFGPSPIYGPGIVMERDFDSGTINLMGSNGQGYGTYYAFVCPRA